MRVLLRAFLALAFLTNNALAAPALTPERQQTLTMKMTAVASGAYRTFGHWVDTLPSRNDRAYFDKNFASLKKLPLKARFIEKDGLEITVGSEKVTIFMRGPNKFRVIGNDFVFDPTESAEKAIARLKKFTTASELFLPRAEALWGKVAVSFVGMWIAGGVACVVMEVTDKKTCAQYSIAAPLAIPAVVIAAAVGSGILAWDWVTGSNKETLFTVKELECSKAPDQPTRIVIVDNKKNTVRAEIFSKGEGKPDRVDVRQDDGKVITTFMNEDFSPQVERSEALIKDPTLVPYAKAQLKAVEKIFKGCSADAARKAAIERVVQLTKDDAPVSKPSSESSTAN